MIAKILSGSIMGIDAYPVEVEVDISSGLLRFDIAGLAMASGEKWHSPKGGTGSGVRLVVEYIMGLK